MLELLARDIFYSEMSIKYDERKFYKDYQSLKEINTIKLRIK